MFCMKYDGLSKYVSKEVMCAGKESTLLRFELMLKYAEESIQEHPCETCADALGDWLYILKEFVSDCRNELR